MSTLVYAALTSKRLSASSKSASRDAEAPGVKTYVDTLASLVPGEILALHAAYISTTTTPPWWTLAVALVLCAVVYLVGRLTAKDAKPLEWWDCFRCSVPVLAFFVWTMLTKPSVFGADWLKATDRQLIGLTLAAVVILYASVFNYFANKK
jgi:hypothetical protein